MLKFGWLPAPKSPLARIFLALFVLFAIGLFITAPKPSQKTELVVKSTNPEEDFKKEFSEEINKDSDNDGLKDWEEAVYKTDISNPDTDGDGTSDGDEIKQNRNPLAKGPKDTVLPPENNPVTFTYDKNNLTQNFTDKLLRDPTFQDILSKKGGAISENTITDYLKQLPKEALTTDPKPPDTSSLNVSNDESELAVRKYLDALVDVYITYGGAFAYGSDLVLFKEGTVDNKPEQLQKLAIMASSFGKIVQDANKLSIPKNILWFHQKEIVLLTKTKNELTAMLSIQKDPLGAFIAVQKRIETKAALTALHREELKQWLIDKKFLVFPKAGYFFFGIKKSSS